jgi:hypothetical protein
LPPLESKESDTMLHLGGLVGSHVGKGQEGILTRCQKSGEIGRAGRTDCGPSEA